MYKQNRMSKSSIIINKSTEGEPIEAKLERVMNNGEPIEDTAPIVYTERKDGVIPAYNPRTDRFEVAIEAMDYVSKSNTAKRQQTIEERKKILEDAKKPKPSVEGDGKAEPTQTTK